MAPKIPPESWRKDFKLKEFPQPEYIRLKHPAVFFHGYGAIATLVKPTPLHDVCMKLRSHGILSFAPNIVPYAKIEVRAESWKNVLMDLLELLQVDKVNIIAHSMGGIDARYAITHLGIAKHTASLTTVCSPHHGTSLAELAINTPQEIRTRLASFADWMGNQLYPDIKSDSLGSASQLTRDYIMNTFNPQNPNHPDIPYYSYSAAIGKGTDQPVKPLILRYQNQHIFKHEEQNDGFVSVKSAKWGKHIKTVPLSHLEQIHMQIESDREEIWEQFWLDVMRMLSRAGH